MHYSYTITGNALLFNTVDRHDTCHAPAWKQQDSATAIAINQIEVCSVRCTVWKEEN